MRELWIRIQVLKWEIGIGLAVLFVALWIALRLEERRARKTRR